MLIDSSHKKWFVWTSIIAVLALAAYLLLDRLTPGGLTGGSTAGLWYAILGSALMIFAGLLSGLRKVPAWSWLGPRKLWLKGHIWLGLLSVVLILCHSGFRWGGLLEQALWVVFGLVILTGIYGLVLQQFLPRLMTARVPNEGPYEQIPHLCEVMRHKADGLVDALCGPPDPKAKDQPALDEFSKAHLLSFYEAQVRSFLTAPLLRSSPLANPLQAEAVFAKVRSLPGLGPAKEQLSLLETLCEERRQLGEQERLHHWLHAWLLIHIPLSVALLVLGIAHAVMSLYY